MRYKFLILILVVTALACWVGTAAATDLRGRVDGARGPIPGVPIALFAQTPNGFMVVRQSQTGPDGMYYLGGVFPGQYLLQIGGMNYPIMVGNMPMQDLPPIFR